MAVFKAAADAVDRNIASLFCAQWMWQHVAHSNIGSQQGGGAEIAGVDIAAPSSRGWTSQEWTLRE